MRQLNDNPIGSLLFENSKINVQHVLPKYKRIGTLRRFKHYAILTLSTLNNIWRNNQAVDMCAMLIVMDLDRQVTSIKNKGIEEAFTSLIRSGDILIYDVKNNNLYFMFIAARHHTVNISNRIVLFFTKNKIISKAGISIIPDDFTDVNSAIIGAREVKKQIKDEQGITFYNQKFQKLAHNILVTHYEITNGMRNREFACYYQPKVSPTGAIMGAEILIRWDKYSGSRWQTPPSPAQFIEIAEQTGLIIQLGEYILTEAIKQMAKWHQQGYLLYPIAVNVSAVQLSHPYYNFMEFIDSIFIQYPYIKEYIEIELTETAILDTTPKTVQMIKELRDKDVKLILDDYGTGNSTISHLFMPINAIKIDKSFIDRIMVSKETEGVVEGIIAIANSLKIQTVAEGVENMEQATKIIEMGGQSLQGYFFSKPITSAEYEKFLQKNTAKPDINRNRQTTKKVNIIDEDNEINKDDFFISGN